MIKAASVLALWLLLGLGRWNPSIAGELPNGVAEVTTKYCCQCHDADTKEGKLDLTSLSFDPIQRVNFDTWVKVFDRVSKGEMPPKGELLPSENEFSRFQQSISDSLISAERARVATEGRSTQRRLNRFEYENTIRELLQAPGLQLKDLLPEDGEAYHFNKVGDALDMSHVQIARYLAAAEYALRQVTANSTAQP